MLEAVEKGENPYVDLNIFLGTCVLATKTMKLLKCIWNFVSFLFWPQRSDKTRYNDSHNTKRPKS